MGPLVQAARQEKGITKEVESTSVADASKPHTPTPPQGSNLRRLN